MTAVDRSRPGNLPPTPTSFVGHDEFVTDVMARLETGRMVTLLGPGGSGKTRLALEIAARVRDEYDDGVWLVHLDALSNPQLVPVDIGRVVGMRQDPHRRSTDALAEHLASRRALIVLDNCEHLATPIARTVEAVLARAADVHILATSQVALHLDGEQVVDVPPLALPAAGSDRIPDVPAVRLFLDRAAMAGWKGDPDDPDTIRAVAGIVTRLDGLPLAIELAAARTGDTSLAEIEAGLAHPFEVLNRGRRTLQAPQLTLQAVVEWSLGLLDAAMRTVVTRLSVFVGGFGVDSAASVLGCDVERASDHIASLVDRALVRELDEVAGVARFAMPGGLRIYAAELLEDSGEAVEVRRRHLDHFSHFARTADRGLRGPDQLVWLLRFETDHDNVRSALQWALAEGEIERAIRLAAATGRFWDWRGHFVGGADWTIRLTESADEDSIPGLVLLLMWRAFFEWEMGETDRARRVAAHATLAGRRSTDPIDAAVALVAPSLIARADGDLATSDAINEEILAIATNLGDRWLAAWGHKNAALIAIAQGRLDAAESEATQAVSRFAAIGDGRGVAWGDIALAEVALARGDDASAEELCRRALGFVAEAEDLQGLKWILEILSALAYDAGDLSRSAMLLGAAHPLHTITGLEHTPSNGSRYDSLERRLNQAMGDRFLEPFHRGQHDPDRVVMGERSAFGS